MIKVAYISHGSEFGGGERSLQLLIDKLNSVESPIKPILIVPQHGSLSEWAESVGIKTYIHHIDDAPAQQFSTLMKRFMWWFKLFKKENIDLVHANDTSAARLCILSCKALFIPLICHIRFEQSQQYYDWVFSKLPKPDEFITVSNYSKNLLKQRFSEALRKVPINTVYNAIDASKFSIHANNKQDHIWNIAIVANLQPVKGHEVFLNMAKQLKSTSSHKFAYHIYGEDIQGEGRKLALQNLTADLGLSDDVTFHGFADDIGKALQSMHIVVCPSLHEPFGRCIIEAMASGNPVIATAVGGIPEIINDSVNGFLVPNKDVEKLSERVLNLREDTRLYDDIVKNAFESVQNNFSDNSYVKHNITVYNKVKKLSLRYPK